MGGHRGPGWTRFLLQWASAILDHEADANPQTDSNGVTRNSLQPFLCPRLNPENTDNNMEYHVCNEGECILFDLNFFNNYKDYNKKLSLLTHNESTVKQSDFVKVTSNFLTGKT